MTCPHCEELREEVRQLRRELAYEIKASDADRVRIVFGLSRQAGKIVWSLYQARGRRLTAEALLLQLDSEGEDQLIKVQVSRIRRAMGRSFIDTYWGSGYALSEVGRLQVEEALEHKSVRAA